MRKYLYLISLSLILNTAYAEDNLLSPPPPAPPPSVNENINNNPQPLPAVPNYIPQMRTNNSKNDGTKKPILTLTEDDKKSLKELDKYIEDIPEAIKLQIDEFEAEMKILRAQSQAAYDKLSQEARLTLKNKKDRIERLSEPAKKIYFRNYE